MYFNNNDIQKLDRIKRLNIINSIPGIKPANLIGTISGEGITNLAIFSSVIHLGSNPPLLGFILRPRYDVSRHTYENISHNGCYTINHVPTSMVENAHYTSAKFDGEVSEFDACGFTEEYLFGFEAPFVKESKLKIGMRYLESIPIEINNTLMIIGKVVHLSFPDIIMQEEGHLDLSAIGSAGISGLNSYYRLDKINRFPYARPEEMPQLKRK